MYISFVMRISIYKNDKNSSRPLYLLRRTVRHFTLILNICAGLYILNGLLKRFSD